MTTRRDATEGTRRRRSRPGRECRCCPSSAPRRRSHRPRPSGPPAPGRPRAQPPPASRRRTPRCWGSAEGGFGRGREAARRAARARRAGAGAGRRRQRALRLPDGRRDDRRRRERAALGLGAPLWLRLDLRLPIGLGLRAEQSARIGQVPGAQAVRAGAAGTQAEPDDRGRGGAAAAAARRQLSARDEVRPVEPRDQLMDQAARVARRRRGALQEIADVDARRRRGAVEPPGGVRCPRRLRREPVSEPARGGDRGHERQVQHEPVQARAVQLAHRRPAGRAVAQVRAQRDHVRRRARALGQPQQRRRVAAALLAGLDPPEDVQEPLPPLRYRPVRLGVGPALPPPDLGVRVTLGLQQQRGALVGLEPPERLERAGGPLVALEPLLDGRGVGREAALELVVVQRRAIGVLLAERQRLMPQHHLEPGQLGGRRDRMHPPDVDLECPLERVLGILRTGAPAPRQPQQGAAMGAQEGLHAGAGEDLVLVLPARSRHCQFPRPPRTLSLPPVSNFCVARAAVTARFAPGDETDPRKVRRNRVSAGRAGCRSRRRRSPARSAGDRRSAGRDPPGHGCAPAPGRRSCRTARRRPCRSRWRSG